MACLIVYIALDKNIIAANHAILDTATDVVLTAIVVQI